MDAYVGPPRLSSYVPGDGTEDGNSSSMSSPCVRAAVPQESSSLTQIVRRLRHERNHSMLPSPRPPSPSICRHVGWSAREDEKKHCFDAIELFLRSLPTQQIEALDDVATITSGRCKSEAEYKAEYATVSTRDSGLSFHVSCRSFAPVRA